MIAGLAGCPGDWQAGPGKAVPGKAVPGKGVQKRPRCAHHESVTDQSGQSACPRCGSGAEVRTVRELFDMLNGAQDQAVPGASQFGRQAQGGDDDGRYDHYNVEGTDTARRPGAPPRLGTWSRDPVSEMAGGVFSAALGFAGRKIGRRVRRTFEERVVPAMQARAAQAQERLVRSRADQDAIVARYPELRGCLRDEVVFCDGGHRTVPISEIEFPVTLEAADALVARLR